MLKQQLACTTLPTLCFVLQIVSKEMLEGLAYSTADFLLGLRDNRVMGIKQSKTLAILTYCTTDFFQGFRDNRVIIQREREQRGCRERFEQSERFDEAQRVGFRSRSN